MNDRELLELAANAAGMDIDPARYDDAWGFALKRTQIWWNPLTDDGDALRTAVKLHMCVTSFTDEQMVGFVVGKDGRNVHEAPGIDPYAATRRAIVRAAAEIGRQMQNGGAA